MSNILKLQVSHKPPVKACGSCRFYVPHRIHTTCYATDKNAARARTEECANGALWEPKPDGFWKRIGNWLLSKIGAE